LRALERTSTRSVTLTDSAGETIICFGDSLTEGVGAAEGEDYPTILSRLLALPLTNATPASISVDETIDRSRGNPKMTAGIALVACLAVAALSS
jgi:hypothetical protein